MLILISIAHYIKRWPRACMFKPSFIGTSTNSAEPDQTPRMRRLIRFFTICFQNVLLKLNTIDIYHPKTHILYIILRFYFQLKHMFRVHKRHVSGRRIFHAHKSYVLWTVITIVHTKAIFSESFVTEFKSN